MNIKIILFEQNLYKWTINELNFDPYNKLKFIYEMNDNKFCSNYDNDTKCIERSMYMKGVIDKLKLLHPEKLIICVVGLKHVNEIKCTNKELYMEYYLNGYNDQLFDPQKYYKQNKFISFIENNEYTFCISLLSLTSIILYFFIKYI